MTLNYVEHPTSLPTSQRAPVSCLLTVQAGIIGKGTLFKTGFSSGRFLMMLDYTCRLFICRLVVLGIYVVGMVGLNTISSGRKTDPTPLSIRNTTPLPLCNSLAYKFLAKPTSTTHQISKSFLLFQSHSPRTDARCVSLLRLFQGQLVQDPPQPCQALLGGLARTAVVHGEEEQSGPVPRSKCPTKGSTEDQSISIQRLIYSVWGYDGI